MYYMIIGQNHKSRDDSKLPNNFFVKERLINWWIYFLIVGTLEDDGVVDIFSGIFCERFMNILLGQRAELNHITKGIKCLYIGFYNIL